MRSGTSGEDVENDFGPVHDARAQLALEIGALYRGQLLVEDHQRGAGLADQGPQFLDLALADMGGRIGRSHILREPAHHVRPGRVHQPGQLLEMFVQVFCILRALAGCRHQHRALGRIANVDH